MALDDKLLFGLRTTTDLTLTVRGAPGPVAPNLEITTAGESPPTVVVHSGGAWTTRLPAGDHVVEMKPPSGTWFDGEVSFELTAAAMIVSRCHGAPPLKTWSASAGQVNDPKDPLPPPSVQATTTAATVSLGQSWLVSTLQDRINALPPTRSGCDISDLPSGAET